MGRISTYDASKNYNKLAREYLETCGREQTKLPKISEFCREYIGANEDTVNRWINNEGKDNGDLCGAIKRIKEAQAEQLQDDGLYGGKVVNNAMAIFLLKANHGLIEAGRLEITGKDGQQIPIYIFGGGFLPPQPSALVASNSTTFRLPQIQSSGLASAFKKDNNGPIGVGETKPD